MAIGVVPVLQRLVLSAYSWTPGQRALLNHPAGPFTIFFWCPFVKWLIVAANINELKTPAKNISIG
jgi:hypothetical protein